MGWFYGDAKFRREGDVAKWSLVTESSRLDSWEVSQRWIVVLTFVVHPVSSGCCSSVSSALFFFRYGGGFFLRVENRPTVLEGGAH